MILNIIKKIYAPIFALLLFSCTHASNIEEKFIIPKDSISNVREQANWFIGTWQNSSKDGVYTETWKRTNDSVFVGESTVVVDHKGTVFYESIQLEQKGTNVFYSVAVKNQNNALPVSFKLTTYDAQHVVFENPQHDFPTKITYRKITNDSIVAEISGMVEGKEKAEQFPMRKISTSN